MGKRDSARPSLARTLCFQCAKLIPFLVALIGFLCMYSSQYSSDSSSKSNAMGSHETPMQWYSRPPSRSPHQGFEVYPVDAYDVSPTTQFAGPLAKNRVPAILRGSAVSAWKALDAWKDVSFWTQSVNHSIEVGKKPRDVKTSTSFTYFSNGYLSSLKTMQVLKDDEPVRVNLSAGELFTDMLDDSNAHVVYYADEVRKMSDGLYGDLQPMEYLAVPLEGQPLTVKKVMLWAGSSGVTTRLHYDYSHNFHVVVTGRKRFLLFPPVEWYNTYLYPSQHPYATKSQFNPDTPDYAAFPRVLHAKAFEAIVSPGEVLYIPPLWHHHVTTIEPTISVNFWSSAASSIMYDDVLKLGIPMQTSWTSTKKTLAAIVYTTEVVGALFQGKEEYVELFFTALWESRIRPLVDDGSLGVKSPWSGCPGKKRLYGSAESDALRESIADAVDRVKLMFLTIPRSEMELYLGDYVEMIATTVVKPQLFATYLNCIVDRTRLE